MRRAAAEAALAVVVTTSACSSPAPQSEGPTPSTTSSSAPPKTVGPYNCSMSAMIPMTVLPPRGPGEPLVSIPTPPGWKVTHDEDSADIRGAIQNPSLSSDGFAPTALVILTDVTGDSSNADQAIEAEQRAVAQVVSVDSVADGTVCGSPSRTVTYRHEGRSGVELITAGKDAAGKVWVCTVAVETTEPAAPDFVKDRDAILGGFQFIPRMGPA